jgi:hypothetical protein
MKPKKWGSLPKKERRRLAVKLFNSIRGQSVVGQALETAIQWMEIDPHPEKRDIEDMEILLEIFGLSRASKTQAIDLELKDLRSDGEMEE